MRYARATTQSVPSIFATAWDGFTQTIEEARRLTEAGAEWNAIVELLRRARDLLDMIELELADNYAVTPSGARAMLVQLRGRLQSLEKVVMPGRY